MARDPVTHTFHSSVEAAANGSPIMTKGLALVGVQIEGITTATITFEGTIDSSNWVAVLAANMQTGATGTTATADGLYVVSVSGLQQLRCRISSYTAGTITATGLGLEQGGISFADIEATIAAGSASIGTVVPLRASTPTLYNVTLTLADTEYSQALPANCKVLGFQCRTSFNVRLAFVTGKVAAPTAPYLTLKADSTYFMDTCDLASGTLYLASSEAGVVVEIEAWA